MTDLRRRWDAHRARGFPAEARGREVDGVDLVLIDSVAAGAIQAFLHAGVLDPGRANVLRGAVEALEKAVPPLSDEAAAYVAELLSLGRVVLGAASTIIADSRSSERRRGTSSLGDVDELIALMEKFVRGEAITLRDANALEGALLACATQFPELEELADDLAHYRPGGGDSLVDFDEMKRKVAHCLQAFRRRI